jgi:hypothetical protein
MRLSVARSVWVVRAVGMAGLLVALLGGVPEGYTPPVVLVLLVLLGGLLAAFKPEHLAASMTLGVVVLWWGLEVRSEVPVGILVAAAGLVAAHVAGTLLAYGPRFMPIPTELALLWSARGFLVWLAAPVVWVVARAYEGRAVPTSYWLAGLLTALVGAVVAALVSPTRQGQ